MSDEDKLKRSIKLKSRKRSAEALIKASNSLKGRKFSTEWIKKLSDSHKGNPGYWTGKHHTDEAKEKLRQYTREKSSQWQGGKSFESYGFEWCKKLRDTIRERDNHTCQLCNKQKPNIKVLHVHHIDYIKTNNFTFNCITLCLNCHMITNHNRDRWRIFFQTYLSDKYGYKNIDYNQYMLEKVEVTKDGLG